MMETAGSRVNSRNGTTIGQLPDRPRQNRRGAGPTRLPIIVSSTPLISSSQPQMSSHTLILSLSGPSSSGKTTLARLLRTILNCPSTPQVRAFILHEDDFYVTDALIPIDPNSGLQDWDCAAAIDVSALTSALKFIKADGRPPDELVSKEDQNEVGDFGVTDTALSEIGDGFRERINNFEEQSITIAIIDGFLLYAPPESDSPIAPVLELLDLKLFIRTTYERTKERRERRKGYVTLEGFWEDPPGYVDKIVWPNYVKDHEWMFEGGDVDGGALKGRVGELEIKVAPGNGEVGMEGLLRWAVKELKEEIEKILEK
jgi:nicotinamide/nicotinate riboside kinase